MYILVPLALKVCTVLFRRKVVRAGVHIFPLPRVIDLITSKACVFSGTKNEPFFFFCSEATPVWRRLNYRSQSKMTVLDQSSVCLGYINILKNFQILSIRPFAPSILRRFLQESWGWNWEIFKKVNVRGRPKENESCQMYRFSKNRHNPLPKYFKEYWE